jgi:hypothetical protein
VLAKFSLGITSIDRTIIQTEEIFKRELSYPWGQCGTKPRTQPFKTERGFFFCYFIAQSGQMIRCDPCGEWRWQRWRMYGLGFNAFPPTTDVEG